MCSTKNTKSESICLWFNSILCIILSISFIIEVSKYMSIINYEKEICNITSVSYPTELPTESTLDLWTVCDCGYNCLARYPCVKLFSDKGDDFIKEDWSESRSKCTYNKDNCNDGEDIMVSTKYLKESIDKVRHLLSKNQTQCYFDKHNFDKPIFIDLDIETSKIKTCVIGSILATIIIMILFYFCLYKRYNNKTGNTTYTSNTINTTKF